MADLHDELNRVLKYSRERLPVSAIHPELRFTRLGAVLREHASEPGDVGELAYQALTSDHKQPLELMPLHLLRDKMQEETNHPLASKFNWERLPEKVALDASLKKAIREHNSTNPPTSSRQVIASHIAMPHSAPANEDARNEVVSKVLADHAWATPADVNESAFRRHRHSEAATWANTTTHGDRILDQWHREVAISKPYESAEQY